MKVMSIKPGTYIVPDLMMNWMKKFLKKWSDPEGNVSLVFNPIRGLVKHTKALRLDPINGTVHDQLPIRLPLRKKRSPACFVFCGFVHGMN